MPQEPSKPALKWLGCCNNGANDERTAAILTCAKRQHKPHESGPPAPRSGLFTVTCNECGYQYSYDTSD